MFLQRRIHKFILSASLVIFMIFLSVLLSASIISPASAIFLFTVYSILTAGVTMFFLESIVFYPFNNIIKDLKDIEEQPETFNQSLETTTWTDPMFYELVQLINNLLQGRTTCETRFFETSQEFQAIVEDMPAIVIKFDPQGEVEYVNQSYCQMFGTETKSGFNLFEFLLPEYHHKFKRTLERIRHDRPLIALEIEFETPKGEVKWVKMVIKGIFDYQQILKSYQGIAIDITNEKMLEAFLKEEQNKQLHVETETLVKIIRDKMGVLNESFINLTADPQENIQRLLNTCCELINASVASYSYINLQTDEYEMLYGWNIPKNLLQFVFPAEGRMGTSVITNPTYDLVVIDNLRNTNYYLTDPSVSNFYLQTYTGKMINSNHILSIGFQQHYTPSEIDKYIVNIIGSAIALEEERRQKVAELTSIANKYNTVFKNVPYLITLLTLEGTVIDINERFVYYANTPREEIIGQSILPYWTNPVERQELIEELKKYRTVKNRIMHFNDKEKKNFYVGIYSADLIQVDGQEVVLSITNDITSEIDTRARFQQITAKYEMILNTVSDSIFLLDRYTGQIYEANAAAESLYGYTLEEMKTLIPDAWLVEKALLKQDSEEQASFLPVRYHRKKDGTIFPVEITINYLEGTDLAVTSVRDISQRTKELPTWTLEQSQLS